MATFDDGEHRWELERRPPQPEGAARAWCSADAYLLNELRAGGHLAPGVRLAIVNDAFGALGVALRRFEPQWWSDSHRAYRALCENLAINGLAPLGAGHVPGHEAPTGPLDVVVMRFPKSLAWQEDQLLRLRPRLAPGALVIAGGMIGHTPRRAFELLKRCVGPTTTSRGWKKARLATARLDPSLDRPPGLAPSESHVPALDATLSSRPNVFSWERLDIGSRIMLAHLGASGRAGDIVDLGCGNGVLALALARAYPNASVLGVDESYQAVASARDNAARLELPPDRVRFEVADDLADVMAGGAASIVCNPPFHEGHAVGDQVAWDLFIQARRALRPGGSLTIVGNRHLRYQEKLGRLFGNCAVVAADTKFVVLRASR